MARGRGEHRHNRKLGSWKIKLYKLNTRVSTVYYVEFSTLCVPRYLKKIGSVKIQLKDVNHRRGKDEKTERDESGKLCLNRDSEKSTQSGRDPPFQSSDCLFFSFILLTFRVLNVFCFQVWVLASIHVSKCFICLPVHGNYNSSVFEAVCRSKVCEVSKLSTDVSLKLDMGNRMVVIKKLTNKYYLFYRDVMFLNHT